MIIQQGGERGSMREKGGVLVSYDYQMEGRMKAGREDLVLCRDGRDNLLSSLVSCGTKICNLAPAALFPRRG